MAKPNRSVSEVDKEHEKFQELIFSARVLFYRRQETSLREMAEEMGLSLEDAKHIVERLRLEGHVIYHSGEGMDSKYFHKDHAEYIYMD